MLQEKRGQLFIALCSLVALSAFASSKQNPHSIGSPEWQKYNRCQHFSEVTEQSAEGLAKLTDSSPQQKKQVLIDAGIDPINEQSVSDLLLQKQIEFSLKYQNSASTAYKEMWNYCMQFSVKAHFYPDALLSELGEYDDISKQ